jgi:hypothetical protein
MAAIVANNADLGRPTIRSDYSASSFPAVASAQESRRMVKLVPSSGDTFAAGSSIRFNIPAGANEVLDGVNSYMSFNVQWTESAADKQWMPSSAGAQGFIDRVLVRNNGNVLEDLQYFPHLAHFLAKTSDPSDGPEIYGLTGALYSQLTGFDMTIPVGDPRTRYKQRGVAPDDKLAHEKMIWPMSEIGVLNTYQYIPVMYMGNSGIALEIVLQISQPGVALRPSSTGASTSVPTAMALTNVELFLELVKMRPSWVASGWEVCVRALGGDVVLYNAKRK